MGQFYSMTGTRCGSSHQDLLTVCGSRKPLSIPLFVPPVEMTTNQPSMVSALTSCVAVPVPALLSPMYLLPTRRLLIVAIIGLLESNADIDA